MIDFTEHIEYVLDHFDFEAVKKTMIALNWTWHDDPEPPTYNELRKTAKRLLVNAAKDNGPWSTGGLEVIRDDDLLILSFIAVTQSNEDALDNDSLRPIAK